MVACMGNWYGSGKKGTVMGIWGTSGNMGNMIGYFIQAFIVNELELNWKFVFFAIGMLLLIIGSYIAFNIECYPGKLGITKKDLDSYEELNKQKEGTYKYGHFKFIDEDNNNNKQEEDFYKRNDTVCLELPLANGINSRDGSEDTPNEELDKPEFEMKKNGNS